jgi:nucleotide-binding universal stress UspA family protein
MREALRIVVPVDGSAPANRAVGYALLLVAGQPGAEIVLVNVQNCRHSTYQTFPQ